MANKKSLKTEGISAHSTWTYSLNITEDTRLLPGSYEGYKGGKKWMEKLNLDLKFKKVFKAWKSYEGVKFGWQKEEDPKFLTLLCVEILCI